LGVAAQRAEGEGGGPAGKQPPPGLAGSFHGVLLFRTDIRMARAGEEQTILKRWLAVALFAWFPAASAQWSELSFVDPGLRWRTLETAAFEVHFAERNRDQARTVAGAAERILPRITSVLRWRPTSRIHLVVLDSADFANGLASPLPFNYTMIFLSPPDEGELLQNREWLELVLTHELFHIVHTDKASGPARGLRSAFGRVPFLFPNALQPGWIIEGLAVQAESDAGRNYGRLGNSQFEAMMRAEVGRGLRSLPEINAGGRGFPLNRDYLYGGYFFAFLQERYGDNAVANFVETYSDNLIPFRVHRKLSVSKEAFVIPSNTGCASAGLPPIFSTR
jgi:hypothetical protein